MSATVDDTFGEIWARYDQGVVIPQCAWCGRVRLGVEWLHPPRAALLAIDTRLTMSHSICPQCVAAQRELDGLPGS